MKKRSAVYPGTFDPVHYGHLDLMHRAAELFDELIVGVFDHGQPSKKLLFTVEQRAEMIKQALDGRETIRVVPYGGLTVDFARKMGARVIVRGLRVFSDFEFEFRMALANQRLASEVEVVNLITREEHTFLSSSIIREIASFHGDVSSMVPPNVEEALHHCFEGLAPGEYSPPVSLRD